MKKITILVIILFILIAVTIFLIYTNLINPDITGSAIEDFQYSYTKAICDEDNFCQDYEIICKNDALVEMNPVTGAVIQHSLDWQDPRDKETIEKMCE